MFNGLFLFRKKQKKAKRIRKMPTVPPGSGKKAAIKTGVVLTAALIGGGGNTTAVFAEDAVSPVPADATGSAAETGNTVEALEAANANAIPAKTQEEPGNTEASSGESSSGTDSSSSVADSEPSENSTSQDTGNQKSTTASGGTEDSGDPGGSENPEPAEDPGQPADPSDTKDTEDTGQTEDSGDPGDTENTGKTKDPAGTGGTEAEDTAESPPTEDAGATETPDAESSSANKEAGTEAPGGVTPPSETGNQETEGRTSATGGWNASGTAYYSPSYTVKINREFRFWTIGKDRRFLPDDCSIYEERDDTSKEVGKAEKGDIVYIIKEIDDDWLYIESGEARGFIKTSDVLSKEESKKEEENVYAENGADTEEAKALYDWSSLEAEATVPWYENSAYTYVRATTQQTVIEKACGLATTDLSIREEENDRSQEVGTLESGGVAYVIVDGEEWDYIESGNVRGFVKSKELKRSDTLATDIDEQGENAYTFAVTTIEPEENKALYHTLTSIKTGAPSSQLREDIVNFASSYIGNPYVWGGTSLTDGADCSGFAQSVFAQFGIRLPRVSQEQVNVGEEISVEEAQPGDLVFYHGSDGSISHVAIYAGDGKTVEALNATAGIIAGNAYKGGGEIYKRILPDDVIKNQLENGEAVEIIPDEEVGGVYTYERWDRNWTEGTRQKALHDQYMAFDEEGFGVIGDRYVVACTTTFGQVGDLIDFELLDGTVIKTVMGDAKNQSDPGCTIWGHMNSANVLEFIVDGSAWYPNAGYSGMPNPGTNGFHEEWAGLPVVRAVNYGSVF